MFIWNEFTVVLENVLTHANHVLYCTRTGGTVEEMPWFLGSQADWRLQMGYWIDRGTNDRVAEESHNTQRNCSTGELVTPSHPDTRKPQKSHKIEVELARPSHFSDVGEKYGKKIPSMIAANKERVSGQAWKRHDKVNAEQFQFILFSQLCTASGNMSPNK